MAVACQHCEGKSDLFLCVSCIAELTTMLTDLPQWIDWLGDTALRRTRMGETGRRSRGETSLPFDPDTESSRQTRQGRAAEMVHAVHNTLTTIARDLEEQRGVAHRPVRVVRSAFVGPLRRYEIRGEWHGPAGGVAWWLAYHVHTIASDESAGQIYAEIDRCMKEIDRVINPPVPTILVGLCTTYFTDTREECARELRARVDAIEVTCHRCKETHNVARLKLRMVDKMDHEKFTAPEILANERKWLPQEFRIPQQTLNRWIHQEKLLPKGYRRGGPDGREVITRHDDTDVPVYLWSDVRRLRAEGPKRLSHSVTS